MPDPFENMEPNDGLRVETIDGGDNLSLWFAVYRGGEPERKPIRLAAWPTSTPQTRGDCTRLLYALDAICRYLNTGGDWTVLEGCLGRLPHAIDLGGYYLHDSYLNTDGDYEHVFVREGTVEAVLWVEGVGGFIDRKTLDEIEREREENAWSRPAEEDGGGAAGTLQPGRSLPPPG